MRVGTTAVIHEDVALGYRDYLRDESRLAGSADSISFPVSEEEIRQTAAVMSAGNTPITIQGARTGITGGASPGGGHILNLGRMNRITSLLHDSVANCFAVTVQPGLILSQLRLSLASKEFDTTGWSAESLSALELLRKSGPWFFPPDPTETSAAIGGMVGANASGACSFHYGATRNYVRRIRVVLATGSVLELRRGAQTAAGRSFGVLTADGRAINGLLPSYRMPAVKNASGYFAADDMDLIDLFIGSEGTLGIFTEIELRLLPSPGAVWGVVVFLPSEENALRFVRSLRSADRRPVAIEFFDSRTLALLRRQKQSNPAFADVPEPPADLTAIYVEFHGDSEDVVGDAVSTMSGTLSACGGDESSTWIATNAQEMERLKKFRHAVPEAVNLLIDERRRTEPGITKLGTDMAVPDEHLERVIAMYRGDLDASGLEYVIFGHIGNNHVHVNILPKNADEYARGKRLYSQWARQVVRMSGTVSAEHGIGKLKTAFLTEMYGERGVAEMRAVKKAFDPGGILNRGNLFCA